MKRANLSKLALTSCAIAGIALSAHAQPDFTYLTEFEAGTPMALAVDSDGGLYYTSFTFSGDNLSKVYYVADPAGNNAIETHVAVVDDDPSPAGRGWHGVAVDDNGVVYVVNETGSADTNEVRKYTAAPEFQLVDEFTIIGEARYNGVCWMGRDAAGLGHIAITTFSTVEIWDELGGPVWEAAGGETFQRDCAYNPDTGDIYISTNRDRSGDGNAQYSVNVLSGGSVENIDGYPDAITDGLIPEGASNTTWGVNAQQIGFDAVNGLIVIVFKDGSVPELMNTIGFYDPANPDTAVLRMDGADSDTGLFAGPADAVTVQQGDSTLLFVSDYSTDRIVVFTTGTTAVDEFWLY